MYSMPRPIRSGGSFEVSRELRVPLEFAYRWCTDYRSDDLTLPNKRWILERTRDHLVFEDLNEDHPDGFEWRRLVAVLSPPDRWHVECRGNRFDFSIWYTLAPGRTGRTTLTIRGRGRYLVPGTRQRIRVSRKTSSVLDSYFRQGWKRLGTKLERDYLKSIRKQRTANQNRVRRVRSPGSSRSKPQVGS